MAPAPEQARSPRIGGTPARRLALPGLSMDALRARSPTWATCSARTLWVEGRLPAGSAEPA
jgi:hypothetical protein